MARAQTRTAVALAGLTAATLAVVPLTAATAAAAARHPGTATAVSATAKAKAAKAKSHGHGFYVVNRLGAAQRVESYGTPSALVRDPAGREHLVTTKPSAADPGQGHIVYFTRDSDHAKWRSRVVPGLINLAGGVQVEAHLSSGDRRVFAVFYRCDGVYVVDASVKAHKLPEPTQIYSHDTCASPTPTSDNPPVAWAGNPFGRVVSVLVHETSGLTSQWVLLSGTPGSEFSTGTPFATEPVPTSNGFTPQQMVVDPLTGRAVVVGTGSDGTNLGIYAVTLDRFNQSWTSPVRIATLSSSTDNYRVEALQSFRNHVYVGLAKPAADVTTHALYLVKGQPSGQWLGGSPVPHTTAADRNLRFGYNTDTEHLHAVWTRHAATAKHSGLMHEAQNKKGGYPKPVYLTHDRHDVATQVTITKSRAPIVGINR